MDEGVLHSQPAKPQRVLACVLCQQRKVRCDRKFPCGNCIKQQAHCVPSTQTARRRRRFPERVLLDRLRKYEDLLRMNNVKFEPLHKETALGVDDAADEMADEPDAQQPDAEPGASPSVSVSTKSEGAYEFKSIWRAMGDESQGHESAANSPISVSLEHTVKQALDEIPDGDGILFGSGGIAVDLSTFHPSTVDIFRLWQLYLDNVNPLLKVTHTPSLQVRIIEAAGNVSSIPAPLEALMFSIYCLATVSLNSEACQSAFGLSKDDLLTKYHFGCRQALSNAKYLKTVDRDCLTALYLYLLSARADTNSRSMHSILGVAIRIAQHMGISNEFALAKHSVFEQEMRRRLWWSLMLYDTRIGEKGDGHRNVSLSPIWDCRVPLNVEDSDLRPDMTEPPVGKRMAGEATFLVVMSELADFVRHTHFHLDFTNPALKPIAKSLPDNGSLTGLRETIENKYLKFCDSENPIRFLTVWVARAYIAKCRLLEHYSKYSSVEQTDSVRDEGVLIAIEMLDCDLMIMSSPLAKGYHWYMRSYFPFPAYMKIVQDLIIRPFGSKANQAWEMMGRSYDARFPTLTSMIHPLVMMFDKIVLLAWDALKVACKDKEPPGPPSIVVTILKRAEMIRAAQSIDTPQSTENQFTFESMGFGSDNILFGLNGQDCFGGVGSLSVPSEMFGQDLFCNSLQWPLLN